MRLDATIRELLPAPPEDVWSALTETEALADWLMPNDFAPEEGRSFTFVPDHETPWEGNVDCKVLELTPPKRMVWSWKTSGMKSPSRVVFELEARGRGTLLVVRHHGDTDEPVGKGLEDGWPNMLAELRHTFERRGPGESR